jgi:hypothetical protein
LKDVIEEQSQVGEKVRITSRTDGMPKSTQVVFVYQKVSRIIDTSKYFTDFGKSGYKIQPIMLYEV